MSASICQWPRQEGDNTIDKSQLVLLTMVLLLSAPPSVDNTERDPFDTTYTSTCRVILLIIFWLDIFLGLSKPQLQRDRRRVY